MLELVGTPYSDKGLGPDSFSCWGIVRFILMNECGMELPEKAIHPHRWPQYVKIHRWPTVRLQKYDIPLFSEIIPGLVNHMGIMQDASNFIHAGHMYGSVVCEPLARYQHKLIAIGRPKL